jgi:photosystem II stability/assembly factor-like uncharacterized protein
MVRRIVMVLTILASAAAHAQSWSSPRGPAGGNGVAFAASGSSIFEFLLFSGVHRSTDGGRSWTPVSAGQIPAENYQAPMLAAAGRTVVFADYYGDCFVSFDEGSSWNRLQVQGGVGIEAIAASEDTLWAAMGAGGCPMGPCPDYSGVYRSTDRGGTWARDESQVGDVNALLLAEGSLFAAVAGGIARSDDGGITFQTGGLAGQNVVSLSLTDALYARVFAGGFYRSLDGGTTWSVIATVPGRGAAIVYGSGQTFFEITDFYNCRNPCTVFYSTTDGGNHWSPSALSILPPNEVSETPNAFLLAGDRFLAASPYRGVLATTDGGASWQTSNDGMVGTLIPAAVDGDSVYGYAGTLLCASRDRGVTWSPISTPDSAPTVLRARSGTLLLGTGSRGVFRSVDAGATWTAGNSGLAGLSVCALIDTGAIFVVGTYEPGHPLHRSFDGRTWYSLPLPGGIVSTCSLASVGGAIFVSDRGSVFRSTDGGESWVAVLRPNDGNDYRRMAGAGRSLFVEVWPTMLMRSDDLGNAWRLAVSVGSGPQAVVASAGDLVIGVGDGLFAGSLRSGLWFPLDSGLVSREVTDAAISGNYLFAFPRGGGVQTMDLSSVVRFGLVSVPAPSPVPVGGR